MIKSLFNIKLFAIFFVLILVAGCGDDSTSGDLAEVSTIEGVAAVGAPLQGSVYLKDATGRVIGPVAIAEDGSFSVEVDGLTPPFFLWADGSVDGVAHSLYAVATTDGITNISPITSLIVSLITGASDPADVYDDPAGFSEVTEESIDEAVAGVLVLLGPILDAYGVDIDPLRDEFTADSTGLDLVLDLIDIEVVVDDETGEASIVVSDTETGEQLAAAMLDDIENPTDPMDIDEVPDVEGVVTGLSATTLSETVIALEWGLVGDALTYRVYRTGELISSMAETSFNDTGLIDSTEYCYTVTSINADGVESADSREACAITGLDTEAPTDPTEESVSAYSPVSILVSWTASTDNVIVAGYNIYEGSELAGTSETNSYIVTGLGESSDHCYRVTAFDGAGNESGTTAVGCATTPVSGTLKWSYTTGDYIYASPALATDGTTYVASQDYYLYAFDSDGALMWRYGSGYYLFGSPSVGEDGTIYVGDEDGFLHAINPDGTGGWIYDSVDYFYTTPAIAEDGTIYIGDESGFFHAVNPGGTSKWIFEGTDDWYYSAPAIGSDGTIYNGDYFGYFYAINPDGTELWLYDSGGDYFEYGAAIGADGTIYAGSINGYLYALNPGGTLKWIYDSGDSFYASPVIAPDGTIYIGSEDGILHAIDPSGALVWSYATGDVINSSAAIGADGTVYVGSWDDYLYAINSDGSLKWSFLADDDLDTSSLTIGPDGTIYFGTYGNSAYAVWEGSGGPSQGPWPMFGHDAQHTGRVE